MAAPQRSRRYRSLRPGDPQGLDDQHAARRVRDDMVGDPAKHQLGVPGAAGRTDRAPAHAGSPADEGAGTPGTAHASTGDRAAESTMNSVSAAQLACFTHWMAASE